MRTPQQRASVDAWSKLCFIDGSLVQPNWTVDLRGVQSTRVQSPPDHTPARRFQARSLLAAFSQQRPEDLQVPGAAASLSPRIIRDDCSVSGRELTVSRGSFPHKYVLSRLGENDEDHLLKCEVISLMCLILDDGLSASIGDRRNRDALQLPLASSGCGYRTRKGNAPWLVRHEW